MKQLTAYIIDGHDVRIRPAPVERQWMDDSDRRFAYRCLPLNIANAHGWELLCTTAFSAIWDGGKSLDSVHVTVGPDATPSAISHFGSGILTFHVPCLFRTDPGIDLYATGPVNRPKDGIAALSGIIETDWSVATFTMNWKLTTPNQPVEFHPGEPICMITPTRRGETESWQPIARDITDVPDIAEGFRKWSESRNQFNKDLRHRDSQAAQDKWQKEYLQGYGPGGMKAPQHQTKLVLREFELPKPPADAAHPPKSS